MDKVTFKGVDYEVVETNPSSGFSSCAQCSLYELPCYEDGTVVCKRFDILHPHASHHLVRL